METQQQDSASTNALVLSTQIKSIDYVWLLLHAHLALSLSIPVENALVNAPPHPIFLVTRLHRYANLAVRLSDRPNIMLTLSPESVSIYVPMFLLYLLRISHKNV